MHHLFQKLEDREQVKGRAREDREKFGTESEQSERDGGHAPCVASVLAAPGGLKTHMEWKNLSSDNFYSTVLTRNTHGSRPSKLYILVFRVW